MFLRAYSRRIMGAWMAGPQDACHAETVEVCVTLEGVMHAVLDGHLCVNERDTVAIIPPNTLHSSWTEGQAVEEIVVHLRADGLQGVERLKPGVWPAAALGGIAALRDAATLAEREAAALALVAAAAASPDEARLSDPRLSRLLAAVQEGLAQPWQVADMAAIAGMSPRALRRAFQQALKTSPRAWLTDLRVLHAARLLDATSRSVSDIALTVGFGSTSRLTEAFTRRRGVSPSAWRGRERAAMGVARGVGQ